MYLQHGFFNVRLFLFASVAFFMLSINFYRQVIFLKTQSSYKFCEKSLAVYRKEMSYQFPQKASGLNPTTLLYADS